MVSDQRRSVTRIKESPKFPTLFQTRPRSVQGSGFRVQEREEEEASKVGETLTPNLNTEHPTPHTSPYGTTAAASEKEA